MARASMPNASCFAFAIAGLSFRPPSSGSWRCVRRSRLALHTRQMAFVTQGISHGELSVEAGWRRVEHKNRRQKPGIATVMPLDGSRPVSGLMSGIGAPSRFCRAVAHGAAFTLTVAGSQRRDRVILRLNNPHQLPCFPLSTRVTEHLKQAAKVRGLGVERQLRGGRRTIICR